MHPHRGFCECPYAKMMTGAPGIPDKICCFQGSDHSSLPGNFHPMRSGDFEFGLVGAGFEHQGVVDPAWSGELHFFQLWINLPAAHKMEPPQFLNAAASVTPTVVVADAPQATAKVLLGERVFGVSSPVKSPYVPCEYIDFELEPGATVEHEVTEGLSTRALYVYRGQVMVAANECDVGEFSLLTPTGSTLVVTAGAEGAGFMWIAGKPLGEPVVQYGPFVMNTKEEIQQCFHDYQAGDLTQYKPVRRIFK